MGGGAAMRVAGKVGGLGVFSGGLRGAAATVLPASQSLRNVAPPVSGIMSNGMVSGGELAEAQKATWEIDDWEFAGGEENSVASESSEPIARVVFGGVPSLQEAKEATSDLKDALDKIYLSSAKSSGHECEGTDPVGQVSGLPLLSNSEYLETKGCITYDPKSASVPKHAMQAFRMLSENPAAQSVVASIACDPKVWNAVMQNEALMGFLQSHKSNDVFEEHGSPINLYKSSEISKVEETGSEFEDAGSEFADTGSHFDPMAFLQKVKHTVAEMVSNLGNYLQSIFGMPPSEKTSADENAKLSSIEKTLGASFIGLATMVIMVVFLKRI